MPASAVVDLRSTFGAAFIGLTVNTMLFGVTLTQTWIYYWNYWNKDPKRLKLLIAFITVMDVFHTFLCVYMVYWYLVLNFGNAENLGYSMWALDIQANTNGIYISAVNFYYARRIYIVSQSIIFPIIIVALVVSGNILGIIIAVREFGMSQLSKFHTSPWMAQVGLVQTIVIEVLIAAMMCWALYRKKTGLARSDSMIVTLMAYAINSGLLTSLLSIAMIITYMIFPSSLVSFAIYWVMSKCCVNSFLAMLNSREYVRDRSTIENFDNPFSLTSIRVDAPSESHGFKSRPAGVSVTVHRSIAPDFAPNKSHDNVGPTFEVPKPVF